jgi:hypothetical protein
VRFPNWFRIVWWIALQGLLALFLHARWTALVSGGATSLDVVVFLVLVVLMLAPIYEEVGLFGIRARQRLRRIEEEVQGIRNDVRNVVELRNQFAPHISIGNVLPPEQLEQLAAQIRRQGEAQGVTPAPVKPEIPPTDSTMRFLQIRIAIERELRRIVASKFPDQRLGSVSAMARQLQNQGLIERDASIAITEVDVIASRALHDEEIPPMQSKFASDVSGWILPELRRIK